MDLWLVKHPRKLQLFHYWELSHSGESSESAEKSIIGCFYFLYPQNCQEWTTLFSLLFGQIERNASSSPHNSFCQQKTFLPCSQYRQGKNPESLRHCSREFALPAFFSTTLFRRSATTANPSSSLRQQKPTRWHTERVELHQTKRRGMWKKRVEFQRQLGLFVTRAALSSLAVSVLLFQWSS